MRILKTHTDLEKHNLHTAILAYQARTELECKTQRTILALYKAYYGFHGVIYFAKHVSKKQGYVGKADGWLRLAQRHNRNGYENRKLSEWLDNGDIVWKILHVCEPDDNAQILENQYIEKLQQDGYTLSNMLISKGIPDLPCSNELEFVSVLSEFVDVPHKDNVVDYNVCWTSKYVAKDGYGTKTIDGKRYKSHRISYVLYQRQLLQNWDFEPEVGWIFRHICNNKRCANPRHIQLGTDKENKWDSIVDGDECAILNWDIVNEIRQRYLSGEINTRAKNPHKEYGVSEGCIAHIIRNNSWYDKNYTGCRLQKSSKFLGVSKNKSGSWSAEIRYDSKKVRIGSFKEEKEAVLARDQYVIDNDLWTPESNVKRGDYILLNQYLFPELR